MKYLILFLIFSHSVSGQSITEKDFDKLSWLQGTWIRTNVKPGKTAHERWWKDNGKEWIGVGVSLKEGDTTFIEKLKIVVKDNAIYYVADVAENKAHVYFKMTEVTSTGFTCENREHDFPKMIAYKKEGNNLKATTSGDGKSIDFIFVKKE